MSTNKFTFKKIPGSRPSIWDEYRYSLSIPYGPTITQLSYKGKTLKVDFDGPYSAKCAVQDLNKHDMLEAMHEAYATFQIEPYVRRLLNFLRSWNSKINVAMREIEQMERESAKDTELIANGDFKKAKATLDNYVARYVSADSWNTLSNAYIRPTPMSEIREAYDRYMTGTWNGERVITDPQEREQYLADAFSQRNTGVTVRNNPIREAIASNPRQTEAERYRAEQAQSIRTQFSPQTIRRT